MSNHETIDGITWVIVYYPSDANSYTIEQNNRIIRINYTEAYHRPKLLRAAIQAIRELQ